MTWRVVRTLGRGCGRTIGITTRLNRTTGWSRRVVRALCRSCWRTIGITTRLSRTADWRVVRTLGWSRRVVRTLGRGRLNSLKTSI